MRIILKRNDTKCNFLHNTMYTMDNGYSMKVYIGKLILWNRYVKQNAIVTKTKLLLLYCFSYVTSDTFHII